MTRLIQPSEDDESESESESERSAWEEALGMRCQRVEVLAGNHVL